MKQSIAIKGFTLLEMLTVIAILALLVVVSIPLYDMYVRRAQASEILSYYDELRTDLNAKLVDGTVSNCNEILAYVGQESDSAVTDHYARVSIGFEALGGVNVNGYLPVLRVCASQDIQGVMGVGVALSSHDEFNAISMVNSGAILNDDLVSFTARLTDQATPACMVPVGGSLTACGGQAATPQPATFQTPQQITQSTTAPPLLAQGAPQCIPPANRMVERQVMEFGSSLDGFVMNTGDLDTGGAITSLTAEIAVVGGQQVAAGSGHGATMFSYASHSDTNAFLIWNPESVTVEFGNQNLDTGLNINDGQNHRVTVTWESSTGETIVYDNGQEAWRGTANQGGTLGGNGKLVLGQDQDSYGGGFGTNDAFQGKIITASMARVAVPGTNIGNGPVHTAVDAQGGLITNVVIDSQGRATDTTGQQQFEIGGSLTSVTQQVSSDLYVTNNCN